LLCLFTLVILVHITNTLIDWLMVISLVLMC